MGTFVFKNNTIESLFGNEGYTYSGYEDISYVDESADQYLWFYQVPIKFDWASLAKEVAGYWDEFMLCYNRIAESKMVIAFTLTDLFSFKLVDNDFDVEEHVKEFNSKLIALSREKRNLKVVDPMEFFAHYDKNSWVNWRFYFISQMAIDPKFAGQFRAWFQKKIVSIALKRKKCLVLDLDNTLWSGVLGEDGVTGITISGDYPGKAFHYFQEAIKALKDNGVILAICSKNNPEDVEQVWMDNPYMVLKKEDFSAVRINWQDKATNIRELSEELNIGTDSMVFIDDNPTERELIKQMLPEVAVPEFPKQPYDLIPFIKQVADDYFRIYTLTDEDKKKTEQYKANAQRKQEEKKFINMEDYLASLQIEIDIEKCNEFNLARIAQMSQKTNQFNLTTHRYTDSDIENKVQNGDWVYCISVRDKFGDNGITGEIIIAKDGNKALIDTLLLSCRILGKGIEEAFIKTILGLLKEQGVEMLEADYFPTLKNAQVKDFYERMGFDLDNEDAVGNKHYNLNLSLQDLKVKEYYKIIVK